MQSNVERRNGAAYDVVLRLVPGGERRLAHLSDGELLENTRRLVGESNRVLSQLLLHLAEVEARGVHRTRACSSLYHYCIYELRFSEDAAARRVSAAKLVKRFPALLEAVERGELHLTGVLMIGPHLTLENQAEVLGRAKFRSKKELARLVRELAPLPLIADVVEPLGPEPASQSPATWERFVTSLAPRVRDLPEGERPSDWLPSDDTGSASHLHSSAPHAPRAESNARDESELSPLTSPSDPSKLDENDETHATRSLATSASVEGRCAASRSAARFACIFGRPEAPRAAIPPPMPAAPLRFGMQFTTTEEHVQLIERAKALLAREAPLSLGALHVEAMKLLVAALEKRKFGTRSRNKKEGHERAESSAAPQRAESAGLGRGRTASQMAEVVGLGRGRGRGRAASQMAEVVGLGRGRGRAPSQMAEVVGHGRGRAEDKVPTEGVERTVTQSERSGAEGGESADCGDGFGTRPECAVERTATARVLELASSAKDREIGKARANESYEGAAFSTNAVAGEQDLVSPAAAKQVEAHGGPAQHGTHALTGASHASGGPQKLSEDSSRSPSRQRGRHVAAAARRAVFERDDGRCTFEDERGERCRETRYLELHHRVAHARGGPPTVTNLTLHCSAHNALVAELDFGRDYITERRHGVTHEACSSQER